MLNRVAVIGVLIGAAALAQFAAAAPVDDMRACIENSGGAAIAACTRAIASGRYKERSLASLHAMRGAEFSKLGKHDLALADYDRAIKLEPKAASIYTGRANAYVAKGDSDRAIADFDQAIRLAPPSAPAYYDRGNAHATKGSMDAAIADYSQAIRLDPQFAGAYANRGNARAAKSDLDGAIADYDQALRLDPQLAFVYGNRGMVYLKLNQVDRAIVDYDAALLLEPNQPYAQYARGIAKLRRGDVRGGNADIAVARLRRSDVAELLARAGLAPPGSAVSPPARPGMSATLAPAALGQLPVKALFEKHHLLGFFAADCSKPVSKDNPYYGNRLNGAYVQADRMSSSTDRDFVMFLDKAGEMSSTEIVVTGTRDGQPTHMIWRIERAAGGAGMRVRPVEVSWGDKKLVTGEKLADSGQEMPWLQRCGAPG